MVVDDDDHNGHGDNDADDDADAGDGHDGGGGGAAAGGRGGGGAGEVFLHEGSLTGWPGWRPGPAGAGAPGGFRLEMLGLFSRVVGGGPQDGAVS